MWLDDDGEDEPISRSVPDPSARQWRHPSEIAAENARAAEQAMAAQFGGGPGRHRAGAGSILWPITVVGGSIAVAAFGVLGLYLMGNPTVDELSAGGSANPVGVIGSSLPVPARRIPDQPTGTDNRLFNREGPADDAAGGDGVGAGSRQDGDGSAAAEADGHRPKSSAPGTTTTLPPRTDPTTNAPPSTTAPAPVPDPLPGPAVYMEESLRSKRLASVVPIDQHLITSASALGGRKTVFLWIDRRWFQAAVAGTDMPSDVALLSVEDRSFERTMPAVSMVDENVHIKSPAYVGYCLSELPSDGAAHFGIDPSPAPAEPGCGDGRVDPEADDSATPDRAGSDVQPVPKYGLEPKPPNNDWEVPPEPPGGSLQSTEGFGHDRAGVIIATDNPAMTLADHIIYEPISTSIRRSDGLAGAPLRDPLGRVVGLVIGSRDYHVSALPIDRAIAIADSLLDRGFGSPAWIGISGRTTPIGMEVDSVDENGPADGMIEPGDTLIAVGGKRLLGRDHLTHLVREAGVGEALMLSLWRDGVGRRNAEVEIIDRPD